MFRSPRSLSLSLSPPLVFAQSPSAIQACAARPPRPALPPFMSAGPGDDTAPPAEGDQAAAAPVAPPSPPAANECPADEHAAAAPALADGDTSGGDTANTTDVVGEEPPGPRADDGQVRGGGRGAPGRPSRAHARAPPPHERSGRGLGVGLCPHASRPTMTTNTARRRRPAPSLPAPPGFGEDLYRWPALDRVHAGPARVRERVGFPGRRGGDGRARLWLRDL